MTRQSISKAKYELLILELKLVVSTPRPEEEEDTVDELDDAGDDAPLVLLLLFLKRPINPGIAACNTPYSTISGSILSDSSID
jgi:hypothetical protein